MATAPYDDWTEDLCIKLIQEYRKRPILWDPKDPYFFKKTMKPEAWEGIAVALGMPADVCKHKMVILQSSFRREKSKIMQSIRESPDDAMCTSTWFAFEELAFLIDKETERKRQTTGFFKKSNEDGPSAIKKSLMEQYNDKNRAEKNKSIKTTSSKKGKKLPNFAPKLSQVTKLDSAAVPVSSPPEQPPSIIPTLVPIPARQRDDTLEEIKSFTNFVAYKMKKYSESTKNCVQQAICDIIFKADQNYYETATFEENFSSFQSPVHDAVAEDGDLDDKTIDMGNGQIIRLQMDHSDYTIPKPN